jgi:HEAT repeat protein
MNAHRPTLLVSAILIAATGCAGGGGRPKHVALPPAPKEAPAPPPRQDVPVDPALAADARREVMAALHDSDPIVRTQAIEALRNAPGPESTREVIRALNDRATSVAFAAAMMAGEMKLSDALPALRRMADDPNPNVRVATLFALHKLGDRRRSQELVRLARHEDPQVRRNVVLALGLLGEKSAIEKVLRPLRGDPDALVRQQVLEAMWRLGDEESIKPLVAMTASAFADDKVFALLALAAPRRQLVRQHARALLAGEEVQTEVTLVAARAMGMLGSDEGYKIATDATRSQDPQQRFLAAVALGAIGRTDAQDELRRLLSDPVPNVQLAAASAVLQLGKGQGGVASVSP